MITVRLLQWFLNNASGLKKQRWHNPIKILALQCSGTETGSAVPSVGINTAENPLRVRDSCCHLLEAPSPAVVMGLYGLAPAKSLVHIWAEPCWEIGPVKRDRIQQLPLQQFLPSPVLDPHVTVPPLLYSSLPQPVCREPTCSDSCGPLTGTNRPAQIFPLVLWASMLPYSMVAAPPMVLALVLGWLELGCEFLQKTFPSVFAVLFVLLPSIAGVHCWCP